MTSGGRFQTAFSIICTKDLKTSIKEKQTIDVQTYPNSTRQRGPGWQCLGKQCRKWIEDQVHLDAKNDPFLAPHKPGGCL